VAIDNETGGIGLSLRRLQKPYNRALLPGVRSAPFAVRHAAFGRGPLTLVDDAPIREGDISFA
jgi:hypothetical protein